MNKTKAAACGLGLALFPFFPLSSAPAAPGGVAPPPPAVRKVIVRTVDGLPIEAEILALDGDRIRVRNTASGRVLFVPLYEQDEAIQKDMDERAGKIHKQLRAMKFRIEVLENPSRDRMLALPQGTRVLNDDGSRPTLPAVGADGKKTPFPPALPPRTLYPGGRCLRIHSLANHGVNVPVKVQIYWYAKLPQKSVWSMESTETVMLDVPPDAANVYHSLPHSFPKPAYQGYSVLITNPANDAILWKDASSPMYLEELEIRHRLREAPEGAAHPRNPGKTVILPPMFREKTP
ncbi:MAG: hypothetical protein LBG65_07920 [Puniceicoccales bacterium]|jgi:hypothetical protein|nr:hypothetical protein [Puniceicoccales bacterium]